MLMAFLCKLAVECDENVPDTEERLKSVKFGYKIKAYILAVKDDDSENVSSTSQSNKKYD